MWSKILNFAANTIAPLLIGGGMGLLMINSYFNLFPYIGNQTLEDRIVKLSTSLQDASKSISSIESEIDKRKQLVAALRSDADQAQKLKDLGSPQVNAVAQALRGQIEAERKATLIQDMIVGGLIGFAIAKVGDLIWARVGKKLGIRAGVEPPAAV